jgi:hypothetical protein
VGAIAQTPLAGDINGDGVVNIADRVRLAAMLGGRENANAAADVNADGAVTADDAEALADILLGQPLYEGLGTATLAVDGTETTIDDLGIGSAAGTFAAPADVVVSKSWRSLGYDGTSDSAVYRLENVPYHETGGLVISLPLSPGRRGAGTEMILLGEEVAAPSSQTYAVATRAVPAVLVNGRLQVELPPIPPPPAEVADEVPSTCRLYVQRVDSLVQDSYPITISRGTRAGLTLDLVTPATTTDEQKQRLVSAMALAAQSISGLGFDLSKRTSPVKIEVKKLAQGTCGLYQPSMVSLNWTTIDINLTLITDPAQATTLKRTLIHEYFHMVQACYDPRCAFVQAKYNAPQLWIDEASAVWIEKLASGGATSDYMKSYAGEAMEGLHVECTGLAFRNAAAHTRAQDHGYGMSLMFQYIFATHLFDDNPTLVNIYRKLADGTAPEVAFLDALSAHNPTTWWDNFLIAYAQSQIGTPPIPFTSTYHNRIAGLTFKSTDPMCQPASRTLKRHDKFQSSVLPVNWVRLANPSADHGSRRLVAQLKAPDDKFGMMAFQQRAGTTSPCVLRTSSLTPMGKYGNDYVTITADTLETDISGVGMMKPAHYLLVRRLEDSAPAAPRAILETWYVDTRIPFQFSQGLESRRLYQVTGYAECEKNLQAEVGSGAGVTTLVTEPGAALDIPVHLQIDGSANKKSFYTTTSYDIRVDHIQSGGGSTSERLATIPYQDTIIQDFTVTLNENDVALVVLVSATEDLGIGAPSGYYFLGTNMFVCIVYRYDFLMQSETAAP